jgi:hypothetical protein
MPLYMDVHQKLPSAAAPRSAFSPCWDRGLAASRPTARRAFLCRIIPGW